MGDELLGSADYERDGSKDEDTHDSDESDDDQDEGSEDEVDHNDESDNGAERVFPPGPLPHCHYIADVTPHIRAWAEYLGQFRCSKCRRWCPVAEIQGRTTCTRCSPSTGSTS